MGVKAGHQRRSQQEASIDVAIPMVARNDGTGTKPVTSLQNLVLKVRGYLRKNHGVHPSEEGLTGRVGTRVPVVALLTGYERGLIETRIGATREECFLSLGLSLDTVSHTVVEQNVDLRHVTC